MVSRPRARNRRQGRFGKGICKLRQGNRSPGRRDETGGRGVSAGIRNRSNLTPRGEGNFRLWFTRASKTGFSRFGPWQMFVEGEKHHDKSKTYRRNNDAWSNFGPQRIWQGRDFNYAFVLSLGLLLSSGRADSNVTQVAGTQKGGASSDGKDAIRPFRVNVPKEQIVDLRRRIAATRWPDKETVNDESQGIQLAESSGSPASAYPEPSSHSPPKARWTAHCPVFLMLCC